MLAELSVRKDFDLVNKELNTIDLLLKFLWRSRTIPTPSKEVEKMSLQ